MTQIIQKRFSWMVSIEIRNDDSAIKRRGACAPSILRLYFDPSRKKWTFGSGSLLCQSFRKRREETTWKWKRIETSLVIVIIMLRALTYVVSYKLFWNWIGVVWFVSQEVWSDRGYNIWHFLYKCLVQIVLLWSLIIGVRITFTKNLLVERIRHLKLNAPQNDCEEDFFFSTFGQRIFFWLRRIFFLVKKMWCRPIVLMRQNALQARLSKKMRRRPIFWMNSDG